MLAVTIGMMIIGGVVLVTNMLQAQSKIIFI